MPVVDASVVVDWIAPGREPESAAMARLRRLVAENADLLAPRLMFDEVGNALLTGIRRRRWSGAAADRAFRALGRLPVRVVDDERHLDRAWDLARRHDNHPYYDMIYVALAERAKTSLITADEALRQRLMLSWVVAP
ncbi:MAG: type II toxin-antitoxin system VapC family toxin [Candidatus Dormibacteria bacterium]